MFCNSTRNRSVLPLGRLSPIAKGAHDTVRLTYGWLGWRILDPTVWPEPFREEFVHGWGPRIDATTWMDGGNPNAFQFPRTQAKHKQRMHPLSVRLRRVKPREMTQSDRTVHIFFPLQHTCFPSDVPKSPPSHPSPLPSRFLPKFVRSPCVPLCCPFRIARTRPPV